MIRPMQMDEIRGAGRAVVLGTHSDGSHSAGPFEVSSEKSKRYTVPVREATRKTYSDTVTESQGLRNKEVRHLRKSYLDWQEAKKIMGKNFIGPDELSLIAGELSSAPMSTIPKVHYDAKVLKKAAKDYLLILGVVKMNDGKPMTLNNMRAHFGFDPAVSEPCFYNQDWYCKEKFADKATLKNKWYLIRKEVIKETRGVRPDVLLGKLKKGEQFPSAILTAFAFFAYYFLHDGAFLWKHDFIWCSDKDKNGDRIYTGRYTDPKKINKNGFNIHRHLSIRPCYGVVTQLS